MFTSSLQAAYEAFHSCPHRPHRTATATPPPSIVPAINGVPVLCEHVGQGNGNLIKDSIELGIEVRSTYEAAKLSTWMPVHLGWDDAACSSRQLQRSYDPYSFHRFSAQRLVDS